MTPTAGSVEISDPGVEVAIPGLLSQEVVVWVEDFGWMGSEDLFAALELEVDAPGFGEEPGSEESLEVLAAVLAVLGERAESSRLDELAAPDEVVETSQQDPGSDPGAEEAVSPEVVRARLVEGLELLAKQGSPWLRVRVEGEGVAEPLVGVEWEGDLLWAETLVAAADVQDHDERFVTPLHEAAAAGALRAALLLLDQGADVEALDARRWLPIHYAARYGHAALVSLFLDHASPVGWRGSDHRSALQLAAQQGHESVVEVLLKRDSPVDDRLASQPTALHLAVLAGHTGVVRQLLAAGAEVSARAGRGVTPLHLAALQADPEMLAALLEAGASAELENHDGRTPRDVASRNGHEGVFSAPADLE